MAQGFVSTQNDNRVKAYSSNLLPLARQESSMLYDRVFVKKDFTGKTFYQDQIGIWKMQRKGSHTIPSSEGRVGVQTPINDPNVRRTRIDIAEYEDARLMGRAFQMQNLSNPLDQSSICVRSSLGIQIDTIIYNGLGAIAKRGEEGATEVQLPTSRIIPVNFQGTGNSGLTVDKVRRSKRLLDQHGVPTADRTFVASAVGLEQMLGSTQVTSADYNNVKALVNGEVDTFMGFKFVFLPDGIIVKNGEIAEYYAFHKTGLCYADLEELFLRVTERNDLSHDQQLYYAMQGGSGRLEEEKVVKVLCDESVVVNPTINIIDVTGQ